MSPGRPSCSFEGTPRAHARSGQLGGVEILYGDVDLPLGKTEAKSRGTMSDNSYECFDLDVTIQQIAAVLGGTEQQVRAAVELLDEGNTIPFIARYRKEATRGLDEIALRTVEDALAKARDLADRKATVLKTIDHQGQLTEELRRRIETCGDKQTLENLYLPYKPKRRTCATIAANEGCNRWPTSCCVRKGSDNPRPPCCGRS